MSGLSSRPSSGASRARRPDALLSLMLVCVAAAVVLAWRGAERGDARAVARRAPARQIEHSAPRTPEHLAPPATGPDAPPSAPVSGHRTLVSVTSPPAEALSSEAIGAAKRATAPTSRSPVRIRGRVRRHGVPVEDFDLSFRVFDPATPGVAGAEEDWDWTDEEGRYEVEVRAPRITIRDARGDPLARLAVPEDRRELTLDIDLP